MFSPVTAVSSTNKTDRHDTAEIMLKVALNTITTTIIYCSTRTKLISACYITVRQDKSVIRSSVYYHMLVYLKSCV